jgi:predicted nucleic acid-binding protein
MSYLIDTNILLRLAKRTDPDRALALTALQKLKSQNEELCYTTQVLVEFWNVCTRPLTARGGLGLTIEAAERKTRLIEKQFRLLPESLVTHQEWRRLVKLHNVKGVQVHDTMLAAVMNIYGITHLLTFNTPDFKRFGSFNVVSPADVI